MEEEESRVAMVEIATRARLFVSLQPNVDSPMAASEMDSPSQSRLEPIDINTQKKKSCSLS